MTTANQDQPSQQFTHLKQPKPIKNDPGLSSTTTSHRDQPTYPPTYYNQPKPIKTDPGLTSTTTAHQDQPTPPSTYPKQPKPIKTDLGLTSITMGWEKMVARGLTFNLVKLRNLFWMQLSRQIFGWIKKARLHLLLSCSVRFEH